MNYKMAKVKKATKTIDTWKKKRWHKILAPKLFNQQVIGETPALEPDMVIGRTVMSNLMHLTRDMKKQHIDVIFEVEKVMGDTAYTQLKTYQINPSFIKRFVRRNRNRIDDSFVCKTKDAKVIRLKPFILTRGITTKSVNTSVRHIAKRFLANYVAKNDYEIIARDLISNKLQRTLVDYLRAVYPIKSCEIRVMQMLKGEVKNIVRPGPIDDLKVKESKRPSRGPPRRREIKRGVQETGHALPMNIKKKIAVKEEKKENKPVEVKKKE